MWNLFDRSKPVYRKLIGHTEFHDEDKESYEPSSSSYPNHEDGESYSKIHHPKYSRLASRTWAISVILLSLIIGFISGQFLRSEYTIDGYLPPYADPSQNINHVIWTLNETFASTPSKANEDAWSSLMPFGRGFVSHPKLTSGTTKAVAGLHQIHCLYGLHTAYYAQTNKLAKLQHRMDHSNPYTPNPYLDGMTEHELGLHHIKHCFEYLRQAVMCAADTNLEEVSIDPRGNSVTEPWVGERVCRNWEEVNKWAEKWRIGDGSGIVG